MNFDQLVDRLVERYDPLDEFDVMYRVDAASGRLMHKNVAHAYLEQEARRGWHGDQIKALNAVGIYRSKYDANKFIRKDRASGKYVEVFPFGKPQA